MKIILTGGSGDLGTALTLQLKNQGHDVFIFDLKSPNDQIAYYHEGSISDRSALNNAVSGMDCIVHIAAWHGYHEFTQQKNSEEFWDVNVTGTFNVFQAAHENHVKNIVFISSESVADKNGIYGWTKVLGEQIAQRAFEQYHSNVITLRPRGFIPYWNQSVYQSFVEWLHWFWKGYVHVNDVAQAVVQSIDLLAMKKLEGHLILPVDRAYDYTKTDLLNWDETGAGSTFRKYYEKYYDLVIKYGFDPSLKPTVQDMTLTKKCLGYHPDYNFLEALEDLKKYDENGQIT